MIRKFFPSDKNYLLESTQLSMRSALLTALITKVKKAYETQHNPLQLEDSFFLKIRNYIPGDLDLLHNFYLVLSGVYRYKYGENQLEILWDGLDHQKKYENEWSLAFDQWTTSFCQNEQFLKAVLDLTVFLPQNDLAQLGENRMNYFIHQYLDVKLQKSNGTLNIKSA